MYPVILTNSSLRSRESFNNGLFFIYLKKSTKLIIDTSQSAKKNFRKLKVWIRSFLLLNRCSILQKIQ